MKTISLLALLLPLYHLGFSQGVGIGTNQPHPSSLLELQSQSRGLLIPRMTAAQKDAINTPAAGLLIWQTDGMQGFYYNNGTPEAPKWVMLSVATENQWMLAGNSNVDPNQHFLGTTNQQPLNFRVNNLWAGQLDSGKATMFGFKAGWQNEMNSNTGFGHEVLYTNSTGVRNTGLGFRALYTNRSGNNNTAMGAYALENSTTASNLAAFGTHALSHNTSGAANSAFGAYALENNTTGDSNVAVGHGALRYTSTTNRNTAVGINALNGPQTDDNTAIGYRALALTQMGGWNTALGSMALQKNNLGNGNTAIGYQALGNSNYIWNTAVGYRSLSQNTSGAGNTALGSNAMDGNTDANRSTAIGYYAEVSGSNRLNATAIGYRSLAECSNCLILGSVQGKNNAESSINVGIGTTTPFRDLTINSNYFGGPVIGFEVGDVELAHIQMEPNSKELRIAAPADGRMIMRSGTTQLKLSSAGTVTIGPSGMVGPYTFLISDSDKDPMIQFQKGATDKGFLQIVNDDIKIGTNTTNDNGNFYVRTNGADRMIVNNSGNVGIGTASPVVKFQVGTNGDGTVARANSWTTFSDERYKTNIEEIPNALEKIENINGYYYHWKAGADDSRQAGLLAQEVESVLPEIVSTDNDGYKSVDYGKMNALLLQAIKEQQAQIIQLKQQLEKLENIRK